jgi:uncharacterized protein YndB with AHSA1/START domain
MSSTATPIGESNALVEREIDINAPLDIVFESIIEEMSAVTDMSGKSLALKFEPRPGGRWYRDLGDHGGYPCGHLWGHVQVIKPPTLLEITGPLMMSFPVLNHVAYRVTANGKSTHVSIKHRAFGELDERFAHTGDGWNRFLAGVKSIATTRASR